MRSAAIAGLLVLVSSGCTFVVTGLDPLDAALPIEDAVAADLALPDLALPDLALPDLALPDLTKPDLAKPDLALPDLALPDLALPDLALPDLTLPDLAVIDPGPSTDVAENVVATWDVGESPNDNPVLCNPMAAGLVSLSAETMTVKMGSEAVKVTYGPDGASYFQAVYPKARNASWNLSGRTGVDFWLNASEPVTYGGWNPPGPTVVLCGPNGSSRRLDTAANLLPTVSAPYIELMVPLAGGGGWTATDANGFNIGAVSWIEFHADPQRGAGTGNCVMWLDGVRFY